MGSSSLPVEGCPIERGRHPPAARAGALISENPIRVYAACWPFRLDEVAGIATNLGAG
ncbi:hypothetical protein [Rhodobacter capsulatus]|uniref:hypothetical protein n=1 Tax=Rhodobacter capsulatus TaxID=1061 RepID=UPI00402943C2